MVVFLSVLGCSENKIIAPDARLTDSGPTSADVGDPPPDVDADGAPPDDTGAPPADSDGDGVADSEDACPGHDDRLDQDGDGVADGCDPCPVDSPDDTDGDGVCDSVDACPDHDDGVDTDGDGVADGCDVCPLDAADDSDGDGICDSSDMCDGAADGMDMDGDGTPDGCDVCPLDAADDSDDDGTCDSDDACPGHDDLADADGDAVADGCDACPGHDDGLDGDSDGVADGCDVCPLDAADDSDGDGVCDSDDACAGSDDGVDSDGDGVADGCDNCPLDDPDDADGDGICDSDPIPLPNGLIVAHTGSEIPEGWALCDGSEGTPDLRGRFILGVLDAEPGLVGGSDAHDHEAFTDVTVMSSGSASPGTRSCAPPGCWCTNKAQRADHSHDMTHDHTIDPDASLPPYVDVLYLMSIDAESLPSQSILGFASLPDVGVDDSPWHLEESVADRFLRGAPSDVPGATGGALSHDHLGYSGMESATGTFHGSYGMTVTSHGASATDLSHSHPYEHDHSMTSDAHLPPHTRLLWLTPDAPSRLPIVGAMAMWSGGTAEIPRGWMLADGTEGTIDMSGFFVMATDTEEEVGVEGGSTEHDHGIGGDSGGWTGTNTGGNGNCSGGGSLMDFHQHDVPSHDHSMTPDANEPPFYTLAVIVYTG